jgi:putative endonuclease
MPPCHGGGRGFESRPVRKIPSKMRGFLFFMAFFVYILQSAVDGSFYKGFSENPNIRLQQHNNGQSGYTSAKMPWMIVFVEEFATKKDALIREKSLKKYSHEQIERLIGSPNNIVGTFV